MQSIKQEWIRLRHRWSQLPRPWQIAGVLVVAAGVVALSFAARLAPTTDQMSVLQGRQFTADEMRRVEMAFMSRGLTDFQLTQSGLRVPRAQSRVYVEALREDGIFSDEIPDIRKEMTSSNILETTAERDIRYQNAKERLLESCLRRMDGIEDAVVIIGVPKAGARGIGSAPQVSTTVSVRTDGAEPLSRQQAYAICDIVAAAVGGLKPEHVSVTDMATLRCFRGESGRSWQQDEDYAERKKQYELDWSERVGRALKFIPDAEVIAEVSLTRVPGGVDDPTSQAVDAVPETLLREDPLDAERAWVPERIAVTVSIPRDYLTQVWRSRHGKEAVEQQAPTSDELSLIERETQQKVEQAVALLSPMGRAVRAVRHINVLWFDRPVDVPATILADRRASQGLGAIVAESHRLTLILGVVGIVAICLVWGVVRDIMGLVRGRSEVTVAPELRVVSHDSGSLQRSAPVVLPSDPTHAELPGESYHAGLTELVREDPQAAVTMLKSWLNKAG
jgi:flagellar biosynthesis/type III secretory pathway M-ring protein FliF/YscJ